MLGFLLSMQIFAQNRTITGKVVDDNGSPIEGVTISVGNAKAQTQNNGTFSLDVPAATKKINFAKFGYTANKASIVNNVANITLAIAPSEDIVVVGYGAAKKQKDVVGSVTTISAKRVQEMPTANVLDALQGKVAGLQIYTSNGEPSSISSARINGVGSISASTTPLYVLDGIPISGGGTISLNPADYEAVSVLTDASATSIYGARAANGVISFTTKKGSANNSRISLNTQYAFSSLISNTKDFFNTAMNTSELLDFWIATGYRTQPQINTLLAAVPNASVNNNTRWDKVYYKDNVPSKQLDLNISGGAGKTTYYVSGSYFKQEGLTFRSDFERFTLRSNVTSNINNWSQIGMNLVGSFDKRQLNPYGSNSTNRGLGLLAQPFYSPNNPITGAQYELIPGWGRYHPNYLENKVKSESDNVQFTPSAYVQLTPIKNLTLRTQAGLEAYDFTTTSLTLPSFLGSVGNGSTGETYTRQVTRTITTTAEYKVAINKKNNVTVLAGNEFIRDNFKSFNGSSTGQADDRLLLVSAGPTNRNAGSSASAYAFLSYFSRLNYAYNDKYLLDISARNDKSSRFGINRRSANFGSVGLLWKAKKENFLANVKWLSDLTIKGSTGTAGNASIGNYESQGLVGTNQYGGQSGFGIAAPGNPDLTWEKIRLTSFTVSVGLWGKLNAKIERYDKLTTQLLFDVPYPTTSGFSSITTNVGGLTNKGWNLTLDADVFRKGADYFTPYATLSYNEQKVTELFQGRQFFIVPNTGVTYAVGQAINYYYPIFKGINTTTGLPEWYQANSDPNKITETQTDAAKVTTTFSATALQQNTGIKRFAPWSGGFGFNGAFKGFYTQCDISFVKGKYLINNDRFFYENPGQFPGFNQSRTILNYWKNPGDVAQFPKNGTQFTQFDSRLIEDASFMRLKTLTIGYVLPSVILKKSNFVKGCKFYITGRNLFTITKYTGPDPEVDSNLSLGANPNTRQLAFGLDFTF